MTVRDRTLSAFDGRTLCVQEGGRLDGRPVLVHGGTPNSRLLFPPDAELAERQGIRLISYDRPGYGGSSPQPGRTVADCAQDVRAIAQELGIERLAVWGISGGGPHALACAALLGDLVPAVAALASPAPFAAEGLDYFADMGELNVEDTKLLLEDRDAARRKCESDRLEMLAANADELLEILTTLLSPVDAAALTPAMVEHFILSAHDAMTETSEGWWEDGVSGVGDWGFDVGAIETPVLLRHGRQDRFVPFGHGEWLAGHIPGVEAILTEDDGHLTLTTRHLESVHAWLLERLD
ncbi:MAG TPA: alpha/beta hydrolase [Solirubrobacteraceae bacterium]